MRMLSFRLRIALLSALVSGIVLTGFGGVCWYWIGQVRLDSLDAEIRSLGARHPGWFANRGNYERLNSALEFIYGDEQQTQLILLVKDAQGRIMFTSAGWPAEIDPDALDRALAEDPAGPRSMAVTPQEDTATNPGLGGWGRRRGQGGRGLGPGGPLTVPFTKVPRFETVRTEETAWRLGMLGTADSTIVLGLDYAPVQAELNRVRNLFLATLPAALLLVGAGGWVVAGRAVRPLRNIAQTAERVTVRGLDQRIALSHEDPEITRLIQVLNRMIDRLEASFRQATRFSADASHELKTPLAIMQGELENALQLTAADSPEQRVFANLLEEVQRLKEVTRSLLLLAQADAGQLRLVTTPVELGLLLNGLAEDVQVLADESRIQVEFSVAEEAWVQGDGPLLRQALSNLLHNAIRYNQADGWIRVVLLQRESLVELAVCNAGPGIPHEDQARIFDRFYRVDAARSRGVEGAGLGLSLAREIVRAHGGSLVLKESAPGRTCFELTLPRLSSPGA